MATETGNGQRVDPEQQAQSGPLVKTRGDDTSETNKDATPRRKLSQGKAKIKQRKRSNKTPDEKSVKQNKLADPSLVRNNTAFIQAVSNANSEFYVSDSENVPSDYNHSNFQKSNSDSSSSKQPSRKPGHTSESPGLHLGFFYPWDDKSAKASLPTDLRNCQSLVVKKVPRPDESDSYHETFVTKDEDTGQSKYVSQSGDAGMKSACFDDIRLRKYLAQASDSAQHRLAMYPPWQVIFFLLFMIPFMFISLAVVVVVVVFVNVYCF